MRAFRTVLVAFALGSAYAACAGRTVVVNGREVAYEDAAQDAFASAKSAYDRGDWATADQAFGTFLGSYAESRLADQALYYQARARGKHGDATGAANAYTELLSQHPTSPLARPAAAELGIVQLKLGRAADAQQTLNSVVGDMKGEEKVQAAGTLAEAAEAQAKFYEAARWRWQAYEAAEMQGNGGGGFADDGRSAQARSTIDERAAALKAYVALLDEKVPFLDVAKLFEDIPKSSAAWAPTALKLARVYVHLADLPRAQATLDALLAQESSGEYAQAAHQLRQLVASRANVHADKLGVLLPLSGRFAAFGKTVLDGIALALPLDDSGPLKIVVKDTKGDPVEAMHAVEELAREEGVLAVIGPIGSAESGPAAVRAEELGLPMISLSKVEGLPGIGPHVFRNMLTSSAQGRALADYAVDHLGLRAFAILQPDIPSGDELAMAFWDEVAAKKGEITGYETYEGEATTFGDPIKRLVGKCPTCLAERGEFSEEEKNIVKNITDPYRRRKELEKLKSGTAPIIDFEALLLPDYYKKIELIAPALAFDDIITNGCDEKDVERIKKTTRRDDLKTVQLLGVSTWDNPDLPAKAGKYVQCAVFVEGFYPQSKRAETKDFVEQFQSAYGTPTQKRLPGILEAEAFDTATFVKRLVSSARPRDRDAFLEAMRAQPPLKGATGDLTFGADREAHKPFFWLTVTKDGFAEFDPADVRPGQPAGTN